MHSFLNSKFGRPKNYNEQNKLFLRKQLQHYYKIYKRTVKIRKEEVSFIDNKTKLISTTNSKKYHKNSFLTPAPNRYQIKGNDVADIVNKQSGTKGPYSCFTGARDETSYYGHMATKVGHTPISTYYDLPREMNRLMLPRNNFVMKIRKGSRAAQKTYIRSMINDLTLCSKDPQLPGPDKYYPQNLFVKKSYNLQRKDKKYIFHLGKFIPEGERFSSMKSLQPGPGRYNPQPIACPCKCGTEYREDISRLTEYQKWKLSPLYAKISHVKVRPNTCDAPHLRNIPGKGLTSVFKSNTKRLLEKPIFNESSTIISKKTKIPNILNQKYLRAIRTPKRETLSFRIKKEDKKLYDIKFNITAKTLQRQRLRSNKAVAFMSSCPRFEGVDGGKETFLANRTILISSGKTTSNINLKNKITDRTTSAKRDLQRLLKLPQRYVLNKKDKVGHNKLGNIFHLPRAKILYNEREL